MSGSAIDKYGRNNTPLASMGGSYSYKMRYDPWFYGKMMAVYSVAFAALISVFAYFFMDKSKIPMYMGIGLFIGVCFLIFGPMYKRYDLRSSIDYCKRQIGASASKKSLQACLERREDYEGMNSGGGFFDGFIFGSILNN